jgi:hypothetical protein
MNKKPAHFQEHQGQKQDAASPSVEKKLPPTSPKTEVTDGVVGKDRALVFCRREF